jgi:tetratricopeptide (TPR) repeat protein
MNTRFVGRILFAAYITFFTMASALGQETDDLLNQALLLVRQVEDPGKTPLSDDKRIALLNRAISQAQKAPNHRLQGHRVLAIQAIRSAIAEIQSGDSTHKAARDLQTAETELGISISLAGETPAPLASPAPVSGTPTAKDYFNKGWTKMHQSDWSGAVVEFDQAIKLDPKDIEAYFERGASKLMLKDRSGGMADYNQALQIDPKNIAAYLKRGEANQMSDPKAAVADYNQVVALDPKNKDAYEGIATVYWMHQDSDGTIVAYDKIIEIDPKDWYAYGCRALAKGAKGDIDGAIADYDEDIRIEPTDFNAFHNRGKLKEKKGDLQGALADINKAIDLGMHEDDVYRERDELKKKLGDSGSGK